MEWTRDTSLTSADFSLSRRGAAAKIELTRPEKRNTLTSSMVNNLRKVYELFAHDNSVSRIYLTGRGSVFCAGMDLSASGKATAADREAHESQLAQTLALFHAIENCPKTTVALINGPCYGGGNGLAFVHDIRVATSNSTFNLTEVRLGLAPCAISTSILREWGIAFCRAAMLTGRPVTAADLYRIGAIYSLADSQAVLHGDLLDSLDETLRGCAPGASAACKELAYVAWSDAGGKYQAETIKRRFLEMMTPSKEAKYGISQFRKGVKTVDWSQLGAASKL